jgi:molybdopterin-guanine dinucleotide biosynthesis protein A
MQTDGKFDDITGVILAGGRSSRMGRDKAMLKVAGISLFERILRVMQDLFSNVLIAGDWQDLTRPGVPCYPDCYPGIALGGIYTGLFEAKTHLIFVSACDLPYPDTNLIRQILSHREGYDVVVPKNPAGLEPLFALYSKACLEPIRDMLERGEYRIYDFYPQIRVRYLGVEELPSGWEWSLMNVNTSEEYHSIKESDLRAYRLFQSLPRAVQARPLS